MRVPLGHGRSIGCKADSVPDGDPQLSVGTGDDRQLSKCIKGDFGNHAHGVGRDLGIEGRTAQLAPATTNFGNDTGIERGICDAGGHNATFGRTSLPLATNERISSSILKSRTEPSTPTILPKFRCPRTRRTVCLAESRARIGRRTMYLTCPAEYPQEFPSSNQGMSDGGYCPLRCWKDRCHNVPIPT